MEIKKLDLQDISGSNVGSSAPSVKKNDKDFTYFGNVYDEPLEYTKSHLQEVKKENYQRGLDEGYKKGSEEVMAKSLEIENAAKEVISQISSNLTEAINKLEQDKREFTIAMAKIVKSAVEKAGMKVIDDDRADVILKMLEKAAHEFKEVPKLSIRVNEEIFENINKKVSATFQSSGYKGTVEVQQDNTVEPRACRIEWDRTGINVNAEEKIKEIDSILNEYIKSL